MSNKNDLAFPVLDRSQTPNATEQIGLTKREYFACAAMNGLLAGDHENLLNSEKIAYWATDAADSVLRLLGETK